MPAALVVETNVGSQNAIITEFVGFIVYYK